METDLKQLLKLLKIELPKNSLAFERGKLKFYRNMYELKADIKDLHDHILTAVNASDSTLPINEFKIIYSRFIDNLKKTLIEQEELRNRSKYLNNNAT